MFQVRRALLIARGRPAPEARGLLRPVKQLPMAAASHGFASASFGPKSSSKWPKRLLITAAVVGIVSYLRRMTPEEEEHRRLLVLSKESVDKGDIEQGTRYLSESFAAIKDHWTTQKTILEACKYAAFCESFGQYEAAVPFYLTAMKNLKAVNPISARSVNGVRIMDRTAQCYHHAGRRETAKRMFEQAIRLYEKYHGEFSASGNDRVVADLDESILHVYLHYAPLLASMERDSEVSLVRQRLVELVHSSPLIRGKETLALDQFDDIMALHAIQEERRRGREEGH